MSNPHPLAAPAFGLLAVTVAASVVAWAGWRWAERVETHRTPPEAGLLREFSEALQSELQRLEQVYEDDLADIEFEAERQGLTKAAPLGKELKGLRQISLLARSKASAHRSVDGRLLSQWPEPVLLPAGQRPPKADSIVLPLDELFPPERRADATGRVGWLRPGRGQWLVHWRVVDPQRAIVELIDRAEVAATTEEHLQQWAATALGPLQTTKGIVGLVTTDGRRVFGHVLDGASRSPEFAQSLMNEFGVWQLEAWDGIEQRHWRDPARVATALSVAGLFLLSGVLAFEQQRRAVQRAEERVSFVNRVSHELRAPVTNMLLNLDLARDELAPALNGASPRLEVVTEEAQRLGRLVANVLTFSRRERGTLDLRSAPCVPDDVIASVLSQFAPALTRRGVQMTRTANASQRVMLDADALAQILANLISNVEKYAADGGILRVESHCAAERLTLAVEDRGPGIPARASERVFQPFERLSDRVDEGATGTGLGLCIARDLAERLGGSLRLVENPAGARFELHLPVALAEIRHESSHCR